MEIEERYEKLVGKCVEKDKFIRHLGSVLRGCRCGLVTESLLEELFFAESQLEKSDYVHLLSPYVHGLTRIRLQGNSLSNEKYTDQGLTVSIDSSAVATSVSWSNVGALGALSSQLLTKQDERPTQPSSEPFHSPQDAQFIPMAENRPYPNTGVHNVPAAFVTRTDLENNRYANDNQLSTTPTQYMSQVVVTLPQLDQITQYQSRINDRFDTRSGEGQAASNAEVVERYADHISETNNQLTSTRQSESDQGFMSRQNTDARNLLNLTEFTYQNFVDNVHFPAVSPAESNSDIYNLQAPVIPLQTPDPREHQVAESHPSSDVKSKQGVQKLKRESSKAAKINLQLKGGHQQPKLCCNVCGKGFSKPSKLNEHVRVHTGDKPFKCSLCQKCFAQRGTLKYHMRIHSGEKPWTCSDCGKTFAQPGQLSSHKLIHRDKDFKCHLCKKSFPEEVLLERHVKIHKKERPHKCDKCGKSFLHSGNLVIHVQKCFVLDDDLKCDECGKSFPSKESLQQHDEEHAKDKPHQCDICLKRFKRPFRLKTHRSSHVDVKQERSHMCELCGQCYGKPSLLKIHMRIHTGEKPFMCDFCGKFLGSANNLRRHVLSHTGERNYECKECGKTFSTTHNLEYHSRIHSGLKPFKCETCGKGFPFSFSLDRHMRTHKRQNLI